MEIKSSLTKLRASKLSYFFDQLSNRSYIKPNPVAPPEFVIAGIHDNIGI